MCQVVFSSQAWQYSTSSCLYSSPWRNTIWKDGVKLEGATVLNNPLSALYVSLEEQYIERRREKDVVRLDGVAVLNLLLSALVSQSVV